MKWTVILCISVNRSARRHDNPSHITYDNTLQSGQDSKCVNVNFIFILLTDTLKTFTDFCFLQLLLAYFSALVLISHCSNNSSCFTYE